MTQTKFPAKTHLDVKRKCDGNSLAGSSKKAKHPEQLMKILAECDKPTRLAGSPSHGKLPVRMKKTSILNQFSKNSYIALLGVYFHTLLCRSMWPTKA